MSRYNAAANLAPNGAGSDAFDFELAPFLPAMDQSGSWNPPLEFVSLHARAEFTRNNQLEQHASEHDHKAYLCICGKGYTRLSALRRHTKETTQARKHQCPRCNYEFKRPGHVEQHLRLIHKDTNEVIKDLLRIRKSEPQQGLELTGTSSAAIPTTHSTETRGNHPVALPGEPWTAQTELFPIVPVGNPSSRPDNYPAFSGLGLLAGFPDFSAHSFTTQAAGFPSFPAGAMYTAQAGFSVGPAVNFVSNPAPYLDENLGPLDHDQASVTMDPIDEFELSTLEGVLMEDSYDVNSGAFGL
ncbi:hypothetical protein Daus18300_010130 [Diaporthe australafricana]|uniref:C2H2-type domain-containing protein n=1 Tax=Diaporthe australafricana TaxID=127596 RepID=A0ABR3WBA3_9PEZI